MQNSGVIASAEELANFRQAFLGQLFGQVHGNLPGPCNAGGSFFGIHVGYFDLVVVGHRFLDIFDRYLPVLDGQKITQRFTCQLDGDLFG